MTSIEQGETDSDERTQHGISDRMVRSRKYWTGRDPELLIGLVRRTPYDEKQTEHQSSKEKLTQM
jgi:hypothetical protein